MRIFAILSLLVLVSCASPQKSPESYYSGTYAPSNLTIENNEFVAHAVVVDKDDVELAEKAAYLRLMKGAKAKGYRYFKVSNAGKSTFIGTRYTVKGKLYKSHRSGSGVFSLDAISRLLQGLPIEKPYVAPKRVRKPVKVTPKKVARKAAPAPAPTPVAVDPEGPTIIMAPEDITGSISKSVTPVGSAGNPMIKTGTSTDQTETTIAPGALSEIPSGVLLRKKR